MTIEFKQDSTKRIKYVCHKCGAEDIGKFFPDEAMAAAINCWQCKAGRGIEVADMLTKKQGMFPVELIES